MYDVGHIFLNIVMAATAIWIIRKYLNIFLYKKSSHKMSHIMWGIYFVFQCYVQFNSGKASVWTTIVGIIIVLAIAFLGYYGSAKKKIFLVVLIFTIGALIEIIIFYLLNFSHINGKEANIIGQVVSKISMIIIVHVIEKCLIKDTINCVPTQIYGSLFVVPVGSIFLSLQTFFLIDMNQNLIVLLIFFGIFLLFNMVQFKIYSKLIRFFMIEQENAIYLQQINMISRNTEEQKKMMENFYKEKHDLTNELMILKHNLESNEVSVAMKNLNTIIQSYDKTESISMCGNSIIDSIINFKYVLAQDKKIKFILKLFIPEELPFDQCDLGIVIGNAIDNAIEATANSKNTEKEIKIVMGVKKEAFVMIIENPYNSNLKTDVQGNLLSSKNDFDNRHGYGIKSIKRVVEKYNGEMIIETNKGMFSLTIAMNFQ